MLILTRRTGEVLRIGDEVSITVLAVKRTEVRFGVAAPKSVAVHREEIYRRIAQETPMTVEPPQVFRPGTKIVRITSKRPRSRRITI